VQVFGHKHNGLGPPSFGCLGCARTWSLAPPSSWPRQGPSTFYCVQHLSKRCDTQIRTRGSRSKNGSSGWLMSLWARGCHLLLRSKFKPLPCAYPGLSRAASALHLPSCLLWPSWAGLEGRMDRLALRGPVKAWAVLSLQRPHGTISGWPSVRSRASRRVQGLKLHHLASLACPQWTTFGLGPSPTTPVTRTLLSHSFMC
jgi:hypothetical protein